MAAMTKMPTSRRARVAGTSFVDPREIISLLFLLVVYALAAISRDNEFIVAVNETGICVVMDGKLGAAGARTRSPGPETLVIEDTGRSTPRHKYPFPNPPLPRSSCE